MYVNDQHQSDSARVATARRAMVSSSHPDVTATALNVLRAGGNAVDAMLTAMPLEQVLEPHLSTIAGGFAMLFWHEKTGTAHYLNAHPDHPQGVNLPDPGGPDTSGARIAVPGTVAGMQTAAELFGTRRWESYFDPAITAAEDGFPMSSGLYGAMVSAYQRLVHFPSGRERYTPEGRLTPVGRAFRQPNLAGSLARIARDDGVDWFQRGEFAEHFVSAVCQTGGSMTLDDLASYEPRWQEPVRFTYQDEEFAGSPLPDTGGLWCAFALGVLEHTAFADRGPWLDSPRAMALIARAMSTADHVIGQYCGDPLAFDIPVEALLAPDYLARTAQLLEGSFPKVGLSTVAHSDRNRDVVAPDLHRPHDRQHTNSHHLAIVDEECNWVSVLHTGYAADFGTGLVVDGIGVNAANVFSGAPIGPGRRICPPVSALLGLRDGHPWLSLGTPGYPPPVVTQVLMNLLSYGMSLESAIEAPRFRFDRQAAGPRPAWGPGHLAVETRIPEATHAGLRSLGINLMPLGDFGPTGSVQAVEFDSETGELRGYADSRRTGHASGF